MRGRHGCNTKDMWCFPFGVDSCKLANLVLLPVVLLLEPACQAQLQGRSEVRLMGCVWKATKHWESWQCCKFPRGRSNTEGARGGNHLYRFHTVPVRLWVHRRKLWEQCPSLHWPVSLHALEWETCIKTSFAQFDAQRSPYGCSPRAGFRCQHVGQGSGAPDGPGGAAVSWCVHASPGRDSASLILVLSEKCESTHSRSDILNTHIVPMCCRRSGSCLE